jgi:hypothetical protein
VRSVRGTAYVQIKLEYMKALTRDKCWQFPVSKYSRKIADRDVMRYGLSNLILLQYVYKKHLILYYIREGGAKHTTSAANGNCRCI